jgi:hypothetical protein
MRCLMTVTVLTLTKSDTLNTTLPLIKSCSTKTNPVMSEI